MALCLASSLVTQSGFNLYDQLVRYNWWYRNGYMSSTGQCFDIGAATRQSLEEFEHRRKQFARRIKISYDEMNYLSDSQLLDQFDVYCSETDVTSNGALMRLAPVPLFFYRFPTDAIDFSGQSGQVTHGDIKAYDACRYYAALIIAVLHGDTKEQILDKKFYSRHKSWFRDRGLCPEIREIAEGSYKREGGYDDGIRGKGYIVNALEAALWAFWSDDDSFETGALAAVNLGDDTDTTAAIYGQLAGACYGYKNLPKKWLKHVYARKFMINLSKWIVYEGQRWKPLEITASTMTQLSTQPQSGTKTDKKSEQKAGSNAKNLQTEINTFASHSYPPPETITDKNDQRLPVFRDANSLPFVGEPAKRSSLNMNQRTYNDDETESYLPAHPQLTTETSKKSGPKPRRNSNFLQTTTNALASNSYQPHDTMTAENNQRETSLRGDNEIESHSFTRPQPATKTSNKPHQKPNANANSLQTKVTAFPSNMDQPRGPVTTANNQRRSLILETASPLSTDEFTSQQTSKRNSGVLNNSKANSNSTFSTRSGGKNENTSVQRTGPKYTPYRQIGPPISTAPQRYVAPTSEGNRARLNTNNNYAGPIATEPKNSLSTGNPSQTQFDRADRNPSLPSQQQFDSPTGRQINDSSREPNTNSYNLRPRKHQ